MYVVILRTKYNKVRLNDFNALVAGPGLGVAARGGETRAAGVPEAAVTTPAVRARRRMIRHRLADGKCRVKI
jgi:hypothetical protein